MMHINVNEFGLLDAAALATKTIALEGVPALSVPVRSPVRVLSAPYVIRIQWPTLLDRQRDVSAFTRTETAATSF